MGQCQSLQLPTNSDPLIGTSVSVTKGLRSSASSPLQKLKLRRRNKLVIETYRSDDDNHNPLPMSPSEVTQPETPASMGPSTPKTLVSMITSLASTSGKYYTTPKKHYTPTPAVRTPAPVYEENDENEIDENIKDRLHLASPSLLLIGFDNVMIPEEVDPDAPSDEEDSYQRFVETSHKEHGVSAWEMEPGPIITSAKMPKETPRPQSSVKRRLKRVTRASSIQRHPLVAPTPGSAIKMPKTPKGSVDRSTLAEFNKLKVQVKLQEHEQKIQRRQKKFEDRYEDVHKSRQLYKDFEDMSSVASAQSETRLKRKDSFDLQDTNSWYYDFSSVVGSDEEDSLDDDNSLYSNQSQYSLLSAASMDSQRKFFAAKQNKTTTKIDQLEATLKRLNDGKKNRGNTVSDADELDNSRRRGDYGPPSCGNSVQCPSISSDYGPGRRLSNASTNNVDYGPLSRSNHSIRSLPIDYGRVDANDDAISKTATKKKRRENFDIESSIGTPIRSGTSTPPRSMQEEDSVDTPQRSGTCTLSQLEGTDKDATPKRSKTSILPSPAKSDGSSRAVCPLQSPSVQERIMIAAHDLEDTVEDSATPRSGTSILSSLAKSDVLARAVCQSQSPSVQERIMIAAHEPEDTVEHYTPRLSGTYIIPSPAKSDVSSRAVCPLQSPSFHERIMIAAHEPVDTVEHYTPRLSGASILPSPAKSDVSSRAVCPLQSPSVKERIMIAAHDLEDTVEDSIAQQYGASILPSPAKSDVSSRAVCPLQSPSVHERLIIAAHEPEDTVEDSTPQQSRASILPSPAKSDVSSRAVCPLQSPSVQERIMIAAHDVPPPSDYGPLSRSNRSIRSLPIDYGRISANDDAISKTATKKKRRGAFDIESSIGTPVRFGTNTSPWAMEEEDTIDMLQRSRTCTSPPLGDTDKNDTPRRSGIWIHPSPAKSDASSRAVCPLQSPSIQERIMITAHDAPPSDERKPVYSVTPSKRSPTTEDVAAALLYSSTPPNRLPVDKQVSNSPPFDEKKRDCEHEEKKEEERVPRWRTFLDNSPSNIEKKPSPPKAAPPQGNIFSMSTEEFLQMADENALTRISKVLPTDEEEDVVKARRLDFASGNNNEEDSSMQPSDEEIEGE